MTFLFWVKLLKRKISDLISSFSVKIIFCKYTFPVQVFVFFYMKSELGPFCNIIVIETDKISCIFNNKLRQLRSTRVFFGGFMILWVFSERKFFVSRRYKTLSFFSLLRGCLYMHMSSSFSHVHILSAAGRPLFHLLTSSEARICTWWLGGCLSIQPADAPVFAAWKADILHF